LRRRSASRRSAKSAIRKSAIRKSAIRKSANWQMATGIRETDGMQNEREWASQLLGEAVIDVWSGLPQEIQQKLFEQALVAAGRGGDAERLRERLAKFLHDHHQRTAAHAGGST
jgi:hypothetical protein